MITITWVTTGTNEPSEKGGLTLGALQGEGLQVGAADPVPDLLEDPPCLLLLSLPHLTQLLFYSAEPLIGLLGLGVTLLGLGTEMLLQFSLVTRSGLFLLRLARISSESSAALVMFSE